MGGWKLTKHVVVGLFQGVINTGIVGGEGNVEDQYEAWRQEQEEVTPAGDMCFAVDAPLTHNCCDDIGPWLRNTVGHDGHHDKDCARECLPLVLPACAYHPNHDHHQDRMALLVGANTCFVLTCVWSSHRLHSCYLRVCVCVVVSSGVCGVNFLAAHLWQVS